MSLAKLFTENLSPRQKLYEAVRAFAFNEGNLEEISKKYGYKPNSLRTLISEISSGKQALFPQIKKGPQTRRTDRNTCSVIVNLRRKEQMNSEEISETLRAQGIKISARTVERILKDHGFPKLHRRSNRQRGLTQKETIRPSRTKGLDLRKMEGFKAECQVSGIFMFLPYIIESGILDIVKKCKLPETSAINKTQSALSMLALKLMGNERLSHIDKYNHDRGLGIFAGLNILPKPTYMCTYSCRTEAEVLIQFQKDIIKKLCKSYPDLYQGDTVNLDFHSILEFPRKNGQIIESQKPVFYNNKEA